MSRKNDLGFGEITIDGQFKHVKKTSNQALKIFKPGDYIFDKRQLLGNKIINDFKRCIKASINEKKPQKLDFTIKVNDKKLKRSIKFVPYQEYTCLFFLQKYTK